MLITTRKKPLLALDDIECFKVMIKWKDAYFVCPPAFQYFLKNKIDLEPYYLNTRYQTEIIDPNRDYSIDGMIGKGFYHTFCEVSSARKFVDYLVDRVGNPSLELYKIPVSAEFVILNSLIPKGALYYKGHYKEVSSEPSYASNQIIYTSLYK